MSFPPVRPFVIGTAGHVDHGKSTLVRALTGIDPDRLAEEKRRAMTIELGFAWLTLPNGQSISIVDVPGHERFIKTMLAGAGGLDAALLVIAADEGPMPQTREHLAILDLLGVTRGVVALTRRDLVDADWLAYVSEEVRELLAGTTLALAPVVPVSSVTGEGLPALVSALEHELGDTGGPHDLRGARLPIDRVFSVAGFGTVVTGTLAGGSLRTGDEVQLYPTTRRARIRGLQTHQTSAASASPGARVAVNLSGVAIEDIVRGQVVAPPGLMTPTQRIDARLRLLSTSPVSLAQNSALDLFTGATEAQARVTLLDRDDLRPGDSAWVQLRLQTPIAVLKGDRFIIRRASPSETIGGGEVIAPDPPRHKRFRPETVRALETLASGTPAERLLQQLAAGPIEPRNLAASVPELGVADVVRAIAEVETSGAALRLAAPGYRDGLLASATWWQAWRDALVQVLTRYHAAQSLRPGISREDARRQLATPSARLFDALIAAAADLVTDDGAVLRLPHFRLELDPARRTAADAWLQAMADTPFTPPGPADFAIDAETIAALLHNAEIVRANDTVFFAPAAWDQLTQGTLAYIDAHGTITMAQFRDHFSVSRKYAQAALEHMDRLKLTRRTGDDRVRATPRQNT
ncbi:MAG: selenocysteine-specific translation elongation factor [Thermomicrobiales bacterium]